MDLYFSFRKIQNSENSQKQTLRYKKEEGYQNSWYPSGNDGLDRLHVRAILWLPVSFAE